MNLAGTRETKSLDYAYRSGQKLWGEDLSPAECEAWYRDELEAYADLGAGNSETYRYVYHALNELHGFGHLPDRTFNHVLGFGAAYGHELLPIKSRIRRVTILETSTAFAADEKAAVPREFVSAAIGGRLPFPDAEFDLITCFGVLHHLPNVSFIIRELSRCLMPSGFLLIREPIISMGDWSRPRPGLTKRERGIPHKILTGLMSEAGLEIGRSALCEFPPLARCCQKLGIEPYNDPLLTTLDSALCRMFRWNLRYHAENLWQKFRPTALFVVATKR